MSLYLDASVLIPLFISEARSQDAERGLTGQALIVSDFAAAEFSAGIARRHRLGEIDSSEATALFANFDEWTSRATMRMGIEAGDIAMAIALVRRLDLGLRAPDAANIAFAHRLGARLFTFDLKMAEAARASGLEVLG